MHPGETSNRVDLAHALDHGEWSPFQRWVLVLAALSFTVDGLANQVLGLAVPAIVNDWRVTRGDFASVQAAGLIGVAIGTWIGGMIGDRYGRRVGLIGSVLLLGVTDALCAGASNTHELLVLRALAGFGIGGAIPNGAALIAEFTPLKRRSMALAVGMVFIPVGGFVSSVLATYLLPAFGWRSLFLAGGLIPIAVAVILILALPESPRFLLHKPQRRVELVKLLGRFGYGFSSDAEFVDGARPTDRSPVAALFGRDTRRETLVLWIGFFFCLMANYTLLSWLPTMFSMLGSTGSQAADQVINPNVAQTSFHLGGIIGGVSCGWMIHTLGSRIAGTFISLGGMLGAAVLAALLYGTPASSLAVFVILVAEGFFIAGIHTALYTLATYAYPPFIRATGVGAASAVGRTGAIASSFTGVWTLNVGGASVFFVSIAGMIGVVLIATLLMRRHIERAAAVPSN